MGIDRAGAGADSGPRGFRWLRYMGGKQVSALWSNLVHRRGSVEGVGSDDYVLGRDQNAYFRLDAQHVPWMIHNGWVLNPAIPVTDGMKIAELGTGTSIWLLHLAASLPATVALDGFDISDQMFPHASLLPPNVSLRTMNAFEPVPEHLVGTYDVVHLRFWAYIVKGNDPSVLIKNAATLLKPGGWLQWEDADNGAALTRGDKAIALQQVIKTAHGPLNFHFGWLGDLAGHAEKGGLQVLDSYHGPIAPAALPLASMTYLGALREFLAGLDRRNDRSLPGSAPSLKLWGEVMRDFRRGEVLICWTAATLLARKPLPS